MDFALYIRKLVQSCSKANFYIFNSPQKFICVANRFLTDRLNNERMVVQVSKRPLIAITLDSRSGSKNSYSNYLYYALREYYSNAVIECGAIPLIIPYDTTAVGEYSTLLDGFVITGGNFDIDPRYYQQDITSDKVATNERRTAFEYALLKKVFDQGKPILGICGGHQLINIFFGGTLIQHIPDSIKNCI